MLLASLHLMFYNKLELVRKNKRKSVQYHSITNEKLSLSSVIVSALVINDNASGLEEECVSKIDNLNQLK